MGRSYGGKPASRRQAEFIEQAYACHGEVYDYSKVVYVNTSTPVTIICSTHGEFQKRPVKHISGGEGCPTCSKNARVSTNVRFVTLEDVATASNEVHQYQYEYVSIRQTNSEYISTNDQLNIMCPIHGAFTQTVNKHIYAKTGCPQCASARTSKVRTKTTEQFIKDSIRVHGRKYTYNDTVYHQAHQHVTITCPTHGNFLITAANHILQNQGCNMCAASGPEQIIHQALTDLNVNFVSQYAPVDCVSPATGKQ